MGALGYRRRTVLFGAACAAALLHGAAVHAGRSEATAPGQSAVRIRVYDAATEWPLRRAIIGAHEWLKEPACQEVLSDFKDLSGALLSDVLAERGLTGQGQLGRLEFWDGSHHRQCQRPGVSALTAPGHHIIYICPVQFRRLSRDPTRAQAVVIHELLHSLGLGENPPSSREITAQVLERCRT